MAACVVVDKFRVVSLCLSRLWIVVLQAKKLLGLTVIATASRPESAAAARAHGADFIVNHREPLKPQLTAAGIDGVEYIFNMQPAHVYFEQYVDIVTPFGKILNIVGTSWVCCCC